MTEQQAGTTGAQAPVAPELSIVMPACDEERNIEAAVDEALVAATPLFASLELVVVDDGSRDRTGALLDARALHEPRLRVLHRANGGHGPALVTALDAARGHWLLLLDSDRQVPLDDLAALVASARAAGGLLGIRAQRDDPPLRRLVSRVLAGWLRVLFGVRVVDAGTPLKILPRACWREIRPLLGERFPLPAVALAVHAVRSRGVAQQPVGHRARPEGQSHLRSARLAAFSLRSLLSLLLLRLRLARDRGVGPEAA